MQIKHALLAILSLAAAAGYTAASASAAELTLQGLIAPVLTDDVVAPEAIISPLTYNGTTTGGPTFNRPNANGNNAPTALSSTGTAVAYDTIQFTVNTPGSYSFLSTASYDNFLILYSGSFNPAGPLTGALIANDDFPTIGRSGFSYTLTAGATYSLVTTGFSNSSAGTFTNTVSAVPEPSTWALLGIGGTGLLGLILRQRRQRLA